MTCYCAPNIFTPLSCHQTSTAGGMTDWDIGSLWKQGIWFYYVFANLLGTKLCTMLIVCIIKNPKRTPSDCMLASVAGACIVMASTCAMQCLINLITGTFYGGDIACQIESIMHVCAILVQFCSVAGVAVLFADQVQHQIARVMVVFRDMPQITRKEPISEQFTLRIIAILWVSCYVMVGLLSLISKLYLVSAGTYCFFSFSSPCIIIFCVILVIALVIMVYCHQRVVRQYQFLLESRARTLNDDLNNRTLWQQFRWRSTIQIILLLVGWGPAVLALLYEWIFLTQASEALVTMVGVGGVSYTFAVPLATALFDEPGRENAFRQMLIACYGWTAIPCKGRTWRTAKKVLATKPGIQALSSTRRSQADDLYATSPTICQSTTPTPDSSTTPDGQRVSSFSDENKEIEVEVVI